MKNKKTRLLKNVALFAAMFLLCLGAASALAQESLDAGSSQARIQEFEQMKEEVKNDASLTQEEKESLMKGLDASIKGVGREEREAEELEEMLKGPSEQEMARLEEYEKYYRFGSLKAELLLGGQKDTLSSGEKTKVIALLENTNNYPVFDGQLYIEVLKGNQEGGLKNGDHLSDRFLAADGIAVDQKSKKRVEFDWQVPPTLAGGEDYKLAAFFTVGSKKYSLSGLTFAENVFAGTLPFQVKSAQKESILIDRNGIKLNGKELVLRSANPSVPSKPSVKFEIPIKNNTQKDEQVRVSYNLYSWDDFANSDELKTKEENVTIPAGQTKTFLYEETEDKTPVKFLLVTAQSASGQKSMLKLRWVDPGAKPVVRVNYAGLTKFPIAKSDKFDAFANYHTASNVADFQKAKIELSLFDRNGKLVEQISKNDDRVSPNILNFSQTFAAKADYDWLKLVAKVYDNRGKIADEGAIIYDASKLPAGSSSLIAAEVAKKTSRDRILSAILAVLLVLLVVALIIYMRKKKKASTLIMFLMVVCFSVYIARIGGLQFSGALFPETEAAQKTYSGVGDVPWPQNNSSNPSSTMGAWQMANWGGTHHSIGIYSYLNLNYGITAEKVEGSVLAGNSLNINKGDKIRFKIAKNGEYFTNGGYYGTPPAYWVDWNPNTDLFSAENKERFASVGKGPIGEVYNPKNYAATVYYIDNSSAGSKRDLYTLLAVQNPTLSVSAGNALGNCVQQDEKNAEGLFTGISYVTCEALNTVSNQPVSLQISNSNFQERLTAKYLTRAPLDIGKLLNGKLSQDVKDCLLNPKDFDKCWVERSQKFFACHDNISSHAVGDVCGGIYCEDAYGDCLKIDDETGVCLNYNSFDKNCYYADGHWCVTAYTCAGYDADGSCKSYSQKETCYKKGGGGVYKQECVDNQHKYDDSAHHDMDKKAAAKGKFIKWDYPCSGESGDLTWEKKMYKNKTKNNYLTIPAYTKTYSLTVNPAEGVTCTSLNVAANPTSVDIGGTSNLTAACNDGKPVPTPVAWTSSNSGVASIGASTTATNTATGNAAGTAAITATAKNGATGSMPLGVNVAPIPGKCGSASGVPACSKPAVNLCDNGTTASSVTGAGPWSWTCSGINGSIYVDYCSATKIADPGPGSESNAFRCPGYTIPNDLSQLCTNSTSFSITRATVSSTQPAEWVCSGTCGVPQTYTNHLDTPEPGQCGTLNGKSLCIGNCPPADHPDLCQSDAGPTDFSPSSDICDSYDLSWKCPGSCNGQPASCSARGKKSCGWKEVNP